MIGVSFGGEHSYDTFGLILTDANIGTPEPKTETVSVPGMNGVLDLTEVLNDEVVYENRTLELTFAVPDARTLWASTLMRVMNYLHGKKMRVVIDGDNGYYYYGRCTVNKYASDRNLGELVIDVDADPYKVDVNSPSETSDWEWDTFSFRDGVIYVTGVTVDGEETVNLINPGAASVCPYFTADADMTVTFDGETYDLAEGTSQIEEIILETGDNYVTFTGTGTVSISYEVRSL